MGLLQEARAHIDEVRTAWKFRRTFPQTPPQAEINALGVAIRTNRRRADRREGHIGTDYFKDVAHAEDVLASQRQAATQSAVVKAGLGASLVVEAVVRGGKKTKTRAALRVLSGAVLLGSAGRDVARGREVRRKERALREAIRRG